MAPKKKSVVWKVFNKIDDKSAKCKLCQTTIKSAGNTTNLMGHLRNVHKATYLEIVENTEENNATKMQPLDFQPSTSKKNNIQSSPETVVDCEETVVDCEETVVDCEEIVVSRTSSIKPKSTKDDSDVIPPPKRQKSIISSFRDINAYCPSGSKARKINNCILFFICKDNQPLSVVEDEGFQQLLKELAPLYKIPSRQSFTRWLDKKYDSLSQILKCNLLKKEYITLTTDIWSDTQQMRSYLGVTAHFGEDLKLNSVTLGVYELDQRHTSEYISEKLLQTCDEWGIIKTKISAVVTDNAANMVKAIGLAFGNKCHIPCFAHTLNLVCKSALEDPELQNIITKMKSIVTWFKQSVVASDDLRKANGDGKKLKQDVPTRWNSTFYMMERFLELRAPINDIVNNHITAPAMLNAYELSIVSEVISLLRPLEAVTKEVSADKYTTSSKIIPLVKCMTSKIKVVALDHLIVKDLQKNLLKEINKRMSAVENVRSLAIATLLDPRFKKMHFIDPIACTNAMQNIREIMKANEVADAESFSTESENSDKIEESFSLWSDHHKLVQKNWKINKSNTSDLSDELSIYLRTPVGRLAENPLEIWKDLQIQFPKLFKIANKYLTIVGSSVPSERLFSKAGQTMNQQRNRLKPKRLNKILFLQGLETKYWDL